MTSTHYFSLGYGARPSTMGYMRVIHSIRDRLRKLGEQEDPVHFHQGPQGQPAPCFDDRCPNPRLSV
jgi:hypothetical protein